MNNAQPRSHNCESGAGVVAREVGFFLLVPFFEYLGLVAHIFKGFAYHLFYIFKNTFFQWSLRLLRVTAC